jgi:hypothetical protein
MWNLTAVGADKCVDMSLSVPEGAVDVIDCVGDVLKLWVDLAKGDR